MTKSARSFRKNIGQPLISAGWEAFQRTVDLNPVWDEEAYKVCKEKNVTIIDLTPEAINQFRKKTLPLWNEVASKSEISAKLVASLKAFLVKKGITLD